jgi:hypothetical protein
MGDGPGAGLGSKASGMNEKGSEGSSVGDASGGAFDSSVLLEVVAMFWYVVDGRRRLSIYISPLVIAEQTQAYLWQSQH